MPNQAVLPPEGVANLLRTVSAMREGYSRQYGTSCVVIESLPADADEVIEYAHDIGAVCEESDGVAYVIQFPGRPIELYTERALRAGVRA